ncbi:phage major tail tube protein, partial [Glaesserella parasuis]
AHSIKATIDGKEVLYYDAYSNKYNVAGQDILQKYRSNIGS